MIVLADTEVLRVSLRARSHRQDGSTTRQRKSTKGGAYHHHRTSTTFSDVRGAGCFTVPMCPEAETDNHGFFSGKAEGRAYFEAVD